MFEVDDPTVSEEKKANDKTKDDINLKDEEEDDDKFPH